MESHLQIVELLALVAVAKLYGRRQPFIEKRYEALRLRILDLTGETNALKALENDPTSLSARQALVYELDETAPGEDIELRRLANALAEAIPIDELQDIGINIGSIKSSGQVIFYQIRNDNGLPNIVSPNGREVSADIGSLSRAAFMDINHCVDAEYTVWYGTNRVPIENNRSQIGYSEKRDSVVHYGSCRIWVPKSHAIGSIGSPWWKRLFNREDDRLRLLEVDTFAPNAYWSSIASLLSMEQPNERHAVVFIHGYNVSFEQAALRAAQIGFDLSIRGAMAFFSWPSQGTLGGYLADAATIEASESAITDFLIAFSEESGARVVHIIAHSMGNRGVLRAFNNIAQRVQKRSRKRFGQVVLAAADVDADFFRQRCAVFSEVAQRATLYVSTRDFAVEASRWLHDFPRAGLVPPVLIAPGIDTINVTNVDMTGLGHGYIAEARDVLGDIHRLIQQDTEPDRRFGLRAMYDPMSNGRFWLIGS